MTPSQKHVAEEWRQVPSQPWIEASSQGRIRAAYEQPLPQGGSRRRTVAPVYGFVVAAVRGGKAKRCIYRVKGKTVTIHRLVCEAFHGPAPSARTCALHRDEDGTNNRPDNLFWGTQKENLNAPGFLKYCAGRTGEDNPYVKGRKAK